MNILGSYKTQRNKNKQIKTPYSCHSERITFNILGYIVLCVFDLICIFVCLLKPK